MADSILISINKEDIKSPAHWNSVLKSNGLDIEISEAFEPLNHSGFIQCKYEGKRVGFEFEVDDYDPADYEGLLPKNVTFNNSIITLTPRDGYKSVLAATAIAAAISVITQGQIIECDNNVVEHTRAIDWINQSIQQFKEYELNSKEAKKEVKRLKKSDEKIRQRLNTLISATVGLKPVDGIRADLYIGFVFKLGNKSAIYSTKNWEFGLNNNLIQSSKELVDGMFSMNEELANSFFPKLESALDEDCYIEEATLNDNNEVFIKLTNGYFLKLSPKPLQRWDSSMLTLNSNYLRFEISEDSIDVSA